MIYSFTLFTIKLSLIQKKKARRFFCFWFGLNDNNKVLHMCRLFRYGINFFLSLSLFFSTSPLFFWGGGGFQTLRIINEDPDNVV